jgi:alpha-1,6-mannosyltransferase
MRIADVNEFYAPTGGGVRTYIDRKMAILADMGHDLTVIAPGPEARTEERAGGGRVIYVRAPRMPIDPTYGLFWDPAPVTALLDALDPDVVECSSPWKPAWIVADWQGRALKAFFMHNDNVEAYPKRWLERFASPEAIEQGFAWYSRYLNSFLERYDTVVTNGPALTRRLHARGVRVDATMTLGIDRAPFSPTLRDEALRSGLLAQCGLPPDAHLLIGIGRHHREKRWMTVVDAVIRAGTVAPVGLVLIGHGGGSREVERRAAGSPHIRLFNPVYDRARLARIMASCDAYIHGSVSEPFGLVVSEALASGAPLIVPSVGGAAEVAEPAFAETFDGDAQTCADAILRLLSRDPAALRRAASEAAAKVRSDRDHAEALVDHYAACIAARGTPAG